MGKIKFNESSVPSTLEEGAIVIVDGVTYVGNSDDEPVAIKIYKEYSALLEQESTDDPTATVLNNELSGTPVWSRASEGQYQVTLADAFDATKTMVFVNNGCQVPGSPNYLIPRVVSVSSDTITIIFGDSSDNTPQDLDTPQNGVYAVGVEIRVYP